MKPRTGLHTQRGARFRLPLPRPLHHALFLPLKETSLLKKREGEKAKQEDVMENEGGGGAGTAGHVIRSQELGEF